MKQLDFLVRIIIPSMRPLHHEDRGTKAYNDAIPIHLSEPEFTAFLLPHLSMPKRGLKCKLGYSRVFNLILWVLVSFPIYQLLIRRPMERMASRSSMECERGVLCEKSAVAKKHCFFLNH
jgi:hypothetical protein